MIGKRVLIGEVLATRPAEHFCRPLGRLLLITLQLGTRRKVLEGHRWHVGHLALQVVAVPVRFVVVALGLVLFEADVACDACE